MIQKDRMLVSKKNATTLSSVKKDVSIIPGGAFEKAILYVHSDGSNYIKSREKRTASSANKRGQKTRRKSYRNKGRQNCRLHKRRLDFEEVR